MNLVTLSVGFNRILKRAEEKTFRRIDVPILPDGLGADAETSHADHLYIRIGIKGSGWALVLGREIFVDFVLL